MSSTPHTTYLEYQALLVSFAREDFSSQVQEWLHKQWSSDTLLEQAIPWARSIPNIYPDTCLQQWSKYADDNNMDRSRTKDSGKTSCVGLFRWTPCGQYVACVIETDTIVIFDLQQQQHWQTLRSHLQHSIRSISFRPTCSWQLAVGCWTGIAWWKRNQLHWLTWKQHKQVEHISWSKDGSLLASFSSLDRCILLWDVGLSQALVLVKETTIPVCDVSFGVCGEPFLFVGHSSSQYHFTILDTLEWKPQRWKKQQRVQSQCKVAWNEHDSASVAIIASSNQLYALDISEQQLLWTEYISNVPDHAHLVDIVWDPSAQRLAVMLLIPDQEYRTLIALYSTQCEPIFRMDLIGWITGPESPSDHALCMSFQPSSCSFGALLAISWSQGTIQLIPLVFAK
ncbi:hypothetical protein GpartN1_g6375.t1 [Galdieria partita]|uniref:Uncharacterized protein n=1 Tax=Galdieria partita TaxID=83374 RepID=A0A9C7Q2F6_9RHOD|nr:hypothetical protein GpartN1_g6375.t1 [Galdieria partita]